jgi:Phosphotransferase enzyme family
VTDPLRAALATGRAHGLPTSDPVVLRDLTNLIVHLRPAPVVARVQLTLGALRGPAWARAEMHAAHFLTAAGAPVAPPASDVDPGPHEADGLLVTFWRHVDHDPTLADAAVAGRSLRELHDAFAAYDGELPTCDRLGEVRRLVDDPELRAFADRLPPLAGEPIHGDAHLKNILWTRDGPLWSDLENVCRGPREFDLACLRFRPSPEADAAIAAYGEHDAEAVERALAYVTLFLAAVTPLVAERAGEEGRVEAQRRIESALAYARTRSTTVQG